MAAGRCVNPLLHRRWPSFSYALLMPLLSTSNPHRPPSSIQERWFEYRAPYLMYWKHEPVPGSAEDGAPDAAIDLRRIRWVP